jgi:MoxR-like ATPase
VTHALQITEVEAARERLSEVRREVGRVFIGDGTAVDLMLVGLLARGHVLLEGVPGTAKTTLVKAFGASLGCTVRRIQFTPDLLPADITGTYVLNPREGTFALRAGPVFGNVVLADEINRAPAKTQSALLEAMQERQVTIGDATHPLPEPFLVFATQNPIEQEGTYPLPEAQVDRFLLKARVDYPEKDEERQILDRMWEGEAPAVSKTLSSEALRGLCQTARRIYVDERLRDYIVALVRATRRPREVGLGEVGPLVAFGASPRATLAFSEAARAMAFLRGRGYVVPEDVKEIAPDVLRHRILLTYEAEAENVTTDAIVERILDHVEVP